ncbi:extracellular dioxygenase [Purpureocillium lilacinum]|uniref:Extracellular dioxygenase n=2 Tax=Purpureocillium lilacinum TaxID=33203 RepID=A0A179HEH5_PURLI|nr:extracellular dioxygenase [Purpureocillium lilacinum]OAQ79932.1 extracellular dioxygenase [Purpureocillium lilacinum]OAQ88665.1 extracellular dioxygenase [Purpureocillium lilacinum]
MPLATTLVALLACVAGVLGHPSSEEDKKAYLETRSRVIAHTRRSLERCADSPEARALEERAVARRIAKAEELRAKYGLNKDKRDRQWFQHYNGLSHDMSYKGYNLNTPAKTLFSSNTTCALVPETIIGPYYVEGELIRSDITDGQKGVRAHVDYQFINIRTCKPMPDLLIDIWHCNALGVYSGVSAPGQGGLDTTYGRGVQKTDADGVVQFDTIFPGHYEGRATHIHVMSTDHARVLPNGTFEGGTVRHIGQTYFDESVIKAVEATEPYRRNPARRTTNLQDFFAGDQATPQYDPLVKHVYLGKKPQDGLLLFLSIGLDPDADYNECRTPAAHWHPGGGEDLPDPQFCNM